MACMCRSKSEIARCQMCGHGIEQKPGKGRARLYCKPCAKSRANVGPREALCLQCGKTWQASFSGRMPKWCSPHCRYKAGHQSRAKAAMCQMCGSEFISASGAARLCKSCRHIRPQNGNTVNCKTCGKAFYRTLSSDQSYCSRPCLWEARRCGAIRSHEDWVDMDAAKNASIVHYFGSKCRACGCAVTRVRRVGSNGRKTAIRGQKADSRSYCSRQCKFDQKRAVSAFRKACQFIERVIHITIAGVPLCHVCGESVPRGRSHTCCKECAIEANRRHWRERYERLRGVRLRPLGEPRQCRLCDRKIAATNVNGRGRSVCDECNTYRSDFKSRARKYGVPYAEFEKRDVFARDAWRCQLCRRAVLKKAKRNKITRRLHPRTASLDHIVPMSKGGPHVESNVQCACLECNVKKHARMIGQRRLF